MAAYYFASGVRWGKIWHLPKDSQTKLRKINKMKVSRELDFMFVCVPAYAYLYTDPGSSMLLLQLLLTGVASGVFYFRKALSRLLSSNRQRTVPEEKSEPHPQQ